LSIQEGSGVFDPLLESGLSYQFYRVNDHLEPDLYDIKEIVQKRRIDSILIINYFGRKPSNFDEIIEYCKVNKIVSIEDNAHCLPLFFDYLRRDEMRSDFAVFSIHKYLGTEAGGILMHRKVGAKFEDTIEKGDLMGLVSAKHAEIVKVRKENFYVIDNCLANREDLDFKPFFQNVIGSFIYPLNYPIRFETQEKRHKMYMRLVENEIIPTALYHQLIPQINLQNYSNSVKISNTILNLPTHQDAKSTDIERMIAILETKKDLLK
jgi:dTDP-4-amino-4,6-dideoxygalactose transaminase